MRGDGWCVLTCVCMGAAGDGIQGGGASVTRYTHTKKKKTRGALNPGVQRSQVCSVIIVNPGVHLLIIGIFRSTSTKTPSVRCPLTRLRRPAVAISCLSQTQIQEVLI